MVKRYILSLNLFIANCNKNKKIRISSIKFELKLLAKIPQQSY